MPTNWEVEEKRRFKKGETVSLLCCETSAVSSKGISVKLPCCNQRSFFMVGHGSEKLYAMP